MDEKVDMTMTDFDEVSFTKTQYDFVLLWMEKHARWDDRLNYPRKTLDYIFDYVGHMFYGKGQKRELRKVLSALQKDGHVISGAFGYCFVDLWTTNNYEELKAIELSLESRERRAKHTYEGLSLKLSHVRNKKASLTYQRELMPVA